MNASDEVWQWLARRIFSGLAAKLRLMSRQVLESQAARPLDFVTVHLETRPSAPTVKRRNKVPSPPLRIAAARWGLAVSKGVRPFFFAAVL